MSKITTKVYGVDMEAVQKLRQFQFLLMKRKLSQALGQAIQVFDKIEFIRHVQVKSELITIPAIKHIAVADSNIHFMDAYNVIVPKSQIFNLVATENTNVIVRLKAPMWGVGSIIYFDFQNNTEKNDFINTIGEIEEFDDSNEPEQKDTRPGSDESEQNDTPPGSDES